MDHPRAPVWSGGQTFFVLKRAALDIEAQRRWGFEVDEVTNSFSVCIDPNYRP